MIIFTVHFLQKTKFVYPALESQQKNKGTCVCVWPQTTDAQRGNSRKVNPNPKFLGTAKAYFVCHIGLFFQISLTYAFIGCP